MKEMVLAPGVQHNELSTKGKKCLESEGRKTAELQLLSESSSIWVELC